MALLDDFLKTADLDDLLKVRQQMGSLSSEEMSQIAKVVADWRDGQAVSNLLFHPTLIPEAIRRDCIDRGLRSADNPYFILAAVVGLQSVDPNELPEDFRKRWAVRLLELVRADGEVLSSRASVTVWAWLRNGEVEEFVRSFPVPDETATKNIVAFTLSRFGQLPRADYCARLRSCGLGIWKRRRFLRKFDEYRQKAGEPMAVFMSMPLLSYIPNYGTVQS